MTVASSMTIRGQFLPFFGAARVAGREGSLAEDQGQPE